MTDTMPMRERMAMALCAYYDELPDTASYLERKSNPGREWFDKSEVLSDIDAVLAVLETPSEAMVDAAVREGHGKTIGERAVNTFTAMVKAIRGGA